MSEVQAPAIVRDAAVASLISAAGQAAGTMTAKAKEAAAAAAAQLNPALPMGERIKAVVDAYAVDLKVDHNVKAIFVAALTIHAAKAADVVVPVIAEGGKKVDKVCKAAEALEMSKHNLIEAASQVREQHGIGRKAGGGRKAAAPAAAPAAAAPTVKTEVDAFVAWLDNLMPYVNDQVYHGKILAHLIENGWTIQRAAQGRKIKGV